jgi:vacuolar protein sorting-associated protein 53
MSERMAFEFCEITRKELTNITQKRKLEIDNKLLTFAIQRTTNFEQLLTKRFLGRSIPKPTTNPQQESEEISDDDWKPFLGLISQCFDAHFDIYVNFTDLASADLITKFVEDVKVNGFPRMLNEDSNNLHNSSADLFIFYKNCMTQCLLLFTNSSLLSKLAFTFQKYLREYSYRVLSSNLPKYIC